MFLERVFPSLKNRCIDVIIEKMEPKGAKRLHNHERVLCATLAELSETLCVFCGKIT